jgi:predicted ATPase/signal transduction histidine kinase
MSWIASYDVNQELHASAATVVHRARRRLDGRRVVIKKPGSTVSPDHAVADLRHEFEILRSLDLAEVAQAIAFEVSDGSAALIVEDGGEPVRTFPRESPADVSNFLRAAIAISRAIQAIHAKGVFHKDIKPQHLLFDSDGNVKIIDFGLSTKQVHEYCQWVDIDSIEGTLAYIAPEQTGRLHRAVDRRSDLYSLGVTFFEMVTGRLPFSSRDPLELVHCHVAKPPPRADALCPKVPAMVASIIEKLMAKDAEDRYQTASGVAADLARCLIDWEQSGTVARFRLGSDDVSDVLMLPQKLYGRDAALSLLQESLHQVRSGMSQLVLLSGPSGVGKSALVGQLRRQLVLSGHFVSGKFDRLNRAEPYSAVVAACRELVRSILTVRTQDFSAKKSALLDALGANGRVMIDLLPELELIVGNQPALAPLGPIESQNRFEQTFDSFLGALVSKDEPLVMFLDDLQWADAASLRLMRLILTSHAETRPLLVLGTYRNDETCDVHPLKIEIDKIRKSATEVREIGLPPLQRDDVAALVADTLSRTTPDVQHLASVLYKKTQGNPFELGQYLGALHRDGLLRANLANHRWEWDLDAIAKLEVMDDVAELVLQRLRALPEAGRHVVSLGAQMGNEFDLTTMTAVSDLSRAQLLSGFDAALREDILIPVDRGVPSRVGHAGLTDESRSERYLFAHERVREGAYQLVDKEERSGVHLRIGRQLRRTLGDRPSDDQLFAVASQMNLGAEHILDGDERRWLAELNLQCARKAQSKAAVAQALGYAEHALLLVGPNACWTTDYAITCAAQIARAECEFLRGDNDRTLSILDEIDSHARNANDRVASLNLRSMVYVHLGRPLDGSWSSVTALRLLGLDFPDPTDREAIGKGIGAEFSALQSELAAASLDGLSELTDPLVIVQMRTLAHAIPATYQSVPPLMVLMVLKATRLLLRHGTTDVTPFFLAQYGIAHLAITKDHAAAQRFAKLAIEIGLRQKNASSIGAAYFLFSSFTGHWCESFERTVEYLDIGLKTCLDAGDSFHGMFCLTFGILHRRLAGVSLPAIRALLPAALEMVERRGDQLNRKTLRLQERLLAVLAGEGEIAGSLDGAGFDEQRAESEMPPNSHCWLRAAQAMVRFQAGQFQEALDAARFDETNVGLAAVVDLKLYKGLAHAALARSSIDDERAGHITGLLQCLDQFSTWNALCPANQGHRRALLVAAVAELRGDVASAMDAYDTAIASAQSNECLEGHALACELCGEFYSRAGRNKIARLYLLEAVAAYEAWGGLGKAEELMGKYPDIELSADDEDTRRTTLRASKTRPTGRRSSSAARSASGTLDIESAMRASQAIASELAADKLLDRLLRILVENAGAQRGVLIVPKDGELLVEAEHTVNPDKVQLGIAKPLASSEVPEKLIRYVARTRQTLVCNNTVAESMSFSDDSYFVACPPRSALALPLLHQGQLSAVLYLENRAVSHGFNPARLSRLEFLAAQAAAALENSRLYEQVQATKSDLERRILDRTRDLRQRNTDLRNVLDAISQGLVTIDREGRLTGECSAKATAWFGPMHEGMSWFDVLAAADATYAREFQSLFAGLAQGYESLSSVREKVPRKLVLGRRTLDVDFSPIGGDGSWVRLLIVISDVTDREQQVKLEMELRQAQKLQAIGELAAGIAHEINTPAQFVGDSVEFLAGAFEQTLALVQSYHVAIEASGNNGLIAEMKLAEDAADIDYTAENAPGALARARDGVTRIATIVRAMKEFAHPDNRQKAMSDLNKAIETTLTIARNEYKYVAEVETQFGELPLVYCHVGDLNQVFLNLIVNSAHAISDVVGTSGAKGRITVRTVHEGGRVRIEIADTGCGIRPAIRDRVFDPFFTTKEVGRGSGQGLAISRSIVVDKHGGSLTFESEVGKGTTFTIRLPVDGSGATE